MRQWMLGHTVRIGVTLSVLSVLLVGGLMPAQAQDDVRYRRVYNARTHAYEYVPERSLRARTENAMRNPVVKQAAIGAGIGAATGVLSDRTSVLKGAGIGALVGAGTGLIDTSRTLEDKPLVRSAAKGALVGTGVSAATDRDKLKGAAVGAAAGAGVHYVKKYW